MLTLILSFVTRKVLKAAVAQAMSQVRPTGNRPHDGNSILAVKFLLPIMEKVFDVPDREERGSDSWVRSLTQRAGYTFRDCVRAALQACIHIFIACTHLRHALRHAFTYSACTHARTQACIHIFIIIIAALRHAFTYSSHALMHALRHAFTYS